MNKLTQADYEALAARWIPAELADQAGITRVDSAEGARLVGRRNAGDYSGLKISYFWPGQDQSRECLLRRDVPDLELKPDGSTKPKGRYIWPPGRSNYFYFAPMTSPADLDRTDLDVVLTEGPLKCISLYRLACYETGAQRWLPIALNGVWGWRGKRGHEPGPDGGSLDVRGPVVDFDRIPWTGRRVSICFDSDRSYNLGVATAELMLARELKSRGAVVRIIKLPDLTGFDKIGVDDFLAHPEGGPERMLQLFDTAKEFEPDLVRHMANDYGNSERIMLFQGDSLLYCHAFRKWLVWDGRRWAVDTSGRAVKLAKLTMTEYLRQAVVAGNEEAQRYARRCLNMGMIKPALEMTQPEICISPEKLDTERFLLNFLNGTVDLRTGKLMKHDRGHRITKLVHFNYNPDARCPTFIDFIYKIMGVDKDGERAERMVSYLKKALGYSLTGITSEKAVFICHGGGDNGKSTFLNLIREIFADYAGLIQIDTLMIRRQESTNASADLADLAGARFVMTSETEEGQRLAESKLKRISQGMGDIKTCRKYENPFTFPETHKLWIDANHKPVVRGTDAAIWNRLHLIPFDVTIPKEEQDEGLPAELLKEAEGIIAWIVQGAVEWRKTGLGRSSEVDKANETWREESDPLKDFIEDGCELGPEFSCSNSVLWRAYKRWAEENGEKYLLGRKHFSARLYKHGFKQVKIHDKRIWKGIKPPPEAESSESLFGDTSEDDIPF